MRKIIESTLMSLDGVVGDQQVWANDYIQTLRTGRFDSKAQAEALERLMASDAVLMGRRTYEAFAGAWPAQTGAYADRINSIRKYVFSSTLERADWQNSTIIRGDAVAEVGKLKQQDGRDLVTYGHGRFAQTLLEHHLLDELQVSIHPVLVGRGMLLFREGEAATLKLVATKTLRIGIVVLSYQPVRT